MGCNGGLGLLVGVGGVLVTTYCGMMLGGYCSGGFGPGGKDFGF